MKIVVLAGGISTERDVSLVTGKMVYRALREKGHKVILLDAYMGYESDDLADIFESEREWDKEVLAISGQNPDLEAVKRSRGGKGFFGPHVLQICQMADIVFMGLHGAFGEDGKVQATFDLHEIRYTGSNALGAAVSMDKSISKQLFRESGIPTPAGIVVRKGHRMDESGMPEFPVVVKACNSGSSVGVYIVNNRADYEEALEKAFTFDDEVVVEQYIKGREFSIGVIEGKALPVIEIAPISGFYDYKNKYQSGSTVETCPAELDQMLTQKMQKYAEMAFEALHIDSYARMDVMMNENGEMFVLEANTLPGMTPTSLLPQEAAAIGYSFPDLCEWLIDVSLRKWNGQ